MDIKTAIIILALVLVEAIGLIGIAIVRLALRGKR